MAKKMDEIEEVMNPETSTEETTAVEQTASNKNGASANKPAPEATITREVKKVKVRVTEDIDCIIAGIPYRIAKDKEASVPLDVAAILCFSKKAYRL